MFRIELLNELVSKVRSDDTSLNELASRVGSNVVSLNELVSRVRCTDAQRLT